jgi:hypothetical protein
MLPIIATAVFVALNLYLWTLRQSQGELFALAAPAGIVYFAALLWYVSRDR